jgi:predicted dehydrogenase
MADKFKVAVIGHTGRGNYGHGVDTVWMQMPVCEIVAVADADEAGRAEAVKRLKAPKAFADYRAMLDEVKPHIVGIGPRWVDQHRDMVLACAERGIHVYLEKPLCRTLAEADAMVAAIEKHDVKLALAHQTRYSPKLAVVREMIDDGKLGTILELRGRGKEDKRGGGEDLWVLGSHVFNLMQYFGGEPNWCFASVLQGEHPVTKADVKPGNEGIGPLAGDNVSATYGLDAGAMGYFASRRDAGVGGSRFGLQIYGSKGIVEILSGGQLPSVWFLADPSWSPGRSKSAWQPVSSQGVGMPEPLPDGGIEAGNVLAVRDLLIAIADDRQPECSIYEGRTTIEMIAGVFESHRQQKPVKIPLENRENPLAML